MISLVKYLLLLQVTARVIWIDGIKRQKRMTLASPLCLQHMLQSYKNKTKAKTITSAFFIFVFQLTWKNISTTLDNFYIAMHNDLTVRHNRLIFSAKWYDETYKQTKHNQFIAIGYTRNLFFSCLVTPNILILYSYSTSQKGRQLWC